MAEDLQVRLVTALRGATYADYLLQRQSVDEIVDAVAKTLVPVVAGFVADREPTRGGSKLGGNPDLPADLPWPTMRDGDAPLAFICQLNLEEVAKHDPQRRLPHPGMWYLFSLCDSDAAYGGTIDETTTAIRYVPAPGALSPRGFPDGLPNASRLQEQPLGFVASLSCEAYNDARKQYEDARFDASIEEVIERALEDLGSHTPELRLLSNARFFRRDIAALYDADGEFELLGFPGELASRQFGEGEIHVVLRRSDLAAGKLGTARVLFEQGT